MNIERMKMAIERLITLPENRGRTFDYTVFFEKTPCGTLACAAGELALYPPFMEMGLYMDKVGVIKLKDSVQRNTGALAEFLDLTSLQVKKAFVLLYERLNLTTYDITAKHVADYLQKLLDEELAKTQGELQ
jgi:hypothetical protein